jgi:hypothetical protein
MATCPVSIWVPYRSEFKGRKYKDWVMAFPETGGGGSRKRGIGTAEERGHHLHTEHTLNEFNKRPNSHPVENPRKKQVQTVLCACLGRCPHERFKLSIDRSVKNDVDGCQPKMRDSSIQRKRKQHLRQHSSGLTSTIISEEVSSPSSVEELRTSPSVRPPIVSYLRLLSRLLLPR